MSQQAWIGAIIGVLIIAGGVWWFTAEEVQAPVVDTSTVPTGDTTSPVGPADTQIGGEVNVDVVPMSATVTYNGDSFSPQEVTIRKGGTVIWKNTSGGSMWVASAQHPSHVVYNGTSRQEHCPDTTKTAFDQCQGGGDYSFTFNKTGTWGYHDHIKASLFGKVNVVE